jgi:hypothetical protein
MFSILSYYCWKLKQYRRYVYVLKVKETSREVNYCILNSSAYLNNSSLAILKGVDEGKGERKQKKKAA